ncbi:MAG: tRNA (adenosine(37)-N6)-dimethylallyltransferase MiaA [Micavibrio aeruginosavorus]|uniref:tRNA dimethylallyltransferase n=1 Tax=Micavibrio aeruginosavorus TaxID=349221 RepID=A0A2W5FJF3_9BACT|nr:MAG: tRNA (adenosine(37)-N6)-dimethylallyltransferase MiaA [Micavibrio aeruginosavorus]
MTSTVHIICGPTASGKSARGLDLAREKNGVIINADSLQIYNRLPILTAQPSGEDKEIVPHRLYNLLEPNLQMTAGAWRQLALTEIDFAIENNQAPIIVGGTGFYLKSLIEGLSPIPEIPASIRIAAEDLMDELGIDGFHEIMREKDPVMAARLHPNDRQRNLRAYEVLVYTGESLAEWQKAPKVEPDPRLVFDIEIIIPERDILYARCDERFKQMVKIGAIEEVAKLDDDIMAGRVNIDAPITRALGFDALQQHVRGELDLETAIFMAQNETRHYAKRQTTWFRNQINLEGGQKNIARAQLFTSY